MRRSGVGRTFPDPSGGWSETVDRHVAAASPGTAIFAPRAVSLASAPLSYGQGMNSRLSHPRALLPMHGHTVLDTMRDRLRVLPHRPCNASARPNDSLSDRPIVSDRYKRCQERKALVSDIRKSSATIWPPLHIAVVAGRGHIGPAVRPGRRGKWMRRSAMRYITFEFAGDFGQSIPEWGWDTFVGQISVADLAGLHGPIAADETPDQIFAQHRAWITSVAGRKLARLGRIPDGPVTVTLSDFEG